MLEVQDEGGIRTIRLARPPVNALNAPLLAALDAAVAAAPAAGVRGIVLTGAGGRWCAGLDVGVLAALDESGLAAFLGTFFRCLRTLAGSTLPIVCAINGASPAGAAVLSLYCDRRVMQRGEGRIGLNEVMVGLYPGPLIHRILMRTVGARLAAEFLSTGALLTPDAALASGFVDELVEPGEEVAAARRWLEQVLALPAHAYRATRALVRADLVAMTEASTVEEGEALTKAWTSPDTRAAIQALVARLQKR
jgi:enoyl-CoA hydratase/carnithine racemase